MTAAETGRVEGDKVWGGGQQKGEWALPLASPLGVLGPGGAPGQTSSLLSQKNEQHQVPEAPKQHSSFQVAELFPYPSEPLFTAREAESRDVAEPEGRGASALGQPCEPAVMDRGHLNAGLTPRPGSWCWRSEQRQLDAPASLEYQWGSPGHSRQRRFRISHRARDKASS